MNDAVDPRFGPPTDAESETGALAALQVIGVLLVAMWIIEIIDSVLLDDWAQGGGIHPREVDGLDGILWSPLLHSGFGHLVSNTIPFAVLGGLVAIRGLGRWLSVTLIVAVGGGLLTWMLAGGGNHIGASGIVFGYFGALLGAAFFERRPATMAPALVALLLYSGLLIGFVPQPGISWEGHLFGFIAGLGAARLLVQYREPTPDYDFPV